MRKQWIKKINVGDTYTTYDGKYHFVNFFKDGDETIAVTRRWAGHKKEWYYYAKPFCLVLYEICLNNSDVKDKEERRKFFEINGEEYWY